MKRLLVPVIIIVAAIICCVQRTESLNIEGKAPNAIVVMGLSSSVSMAGTLGSVIYKNRRSK